MTSPRRIMIERVACLLLCCCFSVASAHAADVQLLIAARIHTSDPEHPVATAIAWDASGHLLAVGDAKALTSRYPDAQRIDAGDAIVVPGLIDAHGHVMDLKVRSTWVDGKPVYEAK